jgi:DNA-binding NtrC family response regulator
MSIKILLVDTDVRRRADRATALELAGFEVVGARTFDEALDAIQRNPPQLLIAAVRLGAFNGLHLVVRAHADRPEMSAIITGERADLGLASDAQRQGAVFLAEPATSSELMATITNVLSLT